MINVFKRKITVNLGENQGDYYCAGYSRKGTADSLAISEQMKEGSSAFTKGEIVGITLDLPARIKQAMLEGQAVLINGLGTFKPAIGVSKLQAKAEDLKTSAISIKGINFTPDAELLSALNAKAEYQWISAQQANADDKNDTSANSTGDSAGTGNETPSDTPSDINPGGTDNPSDTPSDSNTDGDM